MVNLQGLQEINNLLHEVSRMGYYVNNIMYQFLHAIGTIFHVITGGGGWGYGHWHPYYWGYYGWYRMPPPEGPSFLWQIFVVGVLGAIVYCAYKHFYLRQPVWPVTALVNTFGGGSAPRNWPSPGQFPAPGRHVPPTYQSENPGDAVHPSRFHAKEYCKACARCAAAFGFFSKKVHCHFCGEVVCTSCSASRFKVPPFHTSTAVPVCDRCVSFNLSGNHQNRPPPAPTNHTSTALPPSQQQQPVPSGQTLHFRFTPSAATATPESSHDEESPMSSSNCGSDRENRARMQAARERQAAEVRATAQRERVSNGHYVMKTHTH